MVDITQCEECGRVIPATEHGCAYCDSERPVESERPYLPLAIKLLLSLFAVNVMVVFALGLLTFLDRATGWDLLLGLLRMAVAAGTLVAFLWTRPWGRWIPMVFIGIEVVMGLFSYLGWVPDTAWRGQLLGSLWSALFLFLFMRPDVQARFDPKVMDRREVGDLIRLVETGKRD